MSEVDELEGMKLAQSVARARGMVQDPKYPRWWDHGPGGANEGFGWCIDDGPPTCSRVAGLLSYRPDRDIAQAWELEELIDAESVRDGQQWWEWPSTKAKYIHELCDVCGVTYEAEDVAEWYDGWQMTYLGMWLLIHATPEQRCRAFLKAREAARST